MSVVNHPASILTDIRDLERRVTNLERRVIAGTPVTASPNAADLATALVLVNQLKAILVAAGLAQ